MSQTATFPFESTFVRRPAAVSARPAEESLPRLEAVLRRRRGANTVDVVTISLVFAALTVFVAGLF